MTLTMIVRFFIVIFIIFCGAAAGYSLSAQEIASDSTRSFDMSLDLSITRSINALDTPPIVQTSHILSNSLLPVVVSVPALMIAGGYIGKDPYLTETGILTLTSEAATYLVTFGVKALIQRERPYKARPDVITGRDVESAYSFPSGHASGSAAFATMLSLRYPHWYVIAPSVLYSLGVSLSRMNLGVHYLTDVLVGTVVGAGISALVYGLRSKIQPAYQGILPTVTMTSPISPMIIPNAVPRTGIFFTPERVGFCFVLQ